MITRRVSFTQQFILHKGVKINGTIGKETAKKELKQLYKRNCFCPVSVKDMSLNERQTAQQSLMSLCEKRDGSN